ncbi:hypothetical protein L21SP5_01885 [Salinivirga cyanobacteriivorans]|uniref:Uncharacterized protein n=1 Tax=Salinivirga cyanobacteriivorans TaxID=1307839 RepID=A0A0S2HZQ0_9BACT|nr:hypothetical protein L21SP5_01885 [Salinivirga cyanobacteriivorans]
MKKINQKLYIYFCENLYILNLQFTLVFALNSILTHNTAW